MADTKEETSQHLTDGKNNHGTVVNVAAPRTQQLRMHEATLMSLERPKKIKKININEPRKGMPFGHAISLQEQINPSKNILDGRIGFLTTTYISTFKAYIKENATHKRKTHK